jgi:dihydroorotate dehydrogenase (fumarate)
MIDLSTRYLGMDLASPLVASASPLSGTLDGVRRLEDAGAAAIVLHSLFEEQLALESWHLARSLRRGAESFAESLTYFPDLPRLVVSVDAYLEHLRKARAAVNVPIIASLNGVSSGGWTTHAGLLEEAGAAALELNVYDIPTDPEVTASELEAGYVALVREVRGRLTIPLAVKLGWSFTAPAHLARRLDDAGASALVLFNRFYQPDFDLERLEVVPSLTLSTSDELLPRLHWVAILFGHVRADLAVTGGVHTGTDVIKAMMAGARVAMTTSALLRHGIEHLAVLRAGAIAWMEAHEYASIREMQGSMSYRSVADAAAFERANYMKVLGSYVVPPGSAAAGAPADG